MYDDDAELYYTGRIAFTDPDDAGSELAFGPLWDFGTPNAGAVSIWYRNTTTRIWEGL